MHSRWSLTERLTPLPHLPCLSLRRLSFHSNTPVIGVVTMFHDASKIVGMQACICLIDASKMGAPENCLLSGVARMHLCCPPGVLLLTCNPSPDSGSLLLALDLTKRNNWPDWLITHLNNSANWLVGWQVIPHLILLNMMIPPSSQS